MIIDYHFYKMSNCILLKFKENPNGLKFDIGFEWLTLAKDTVVKPFTKMMKAKMILSKLDVYPYIDDIFEEFFMIYVKKNHIWNFLILIIFLLL